MSFIVQHLDITWLGPCTQWSLHPFQVTATHCLESLEEQYYLYMYIIHVYIMKFTGSQSWNELQWFFKDEMYKGTVNSFCETVEIPSGQVSTHCIAAQHSLESLDVYLDQAITKEWSQPVTGHVPHLTDSRFAPSQWETALLCNDVSHLLGTSLESALLTDSPTATRLWLCSSLSSCPSPHWVLLPPGCDCVAVYHHVPHLTDSPTATRLWLCSSLIMKRLFCIVAHFRILRIPCMNWGRSWMIQGHPSLIH